MKQYLMILSLEHYAKMQELFPGAQFIELQGMGLGNSPTHQVLVTPMKPVLEPVEMQPPIQEPCCEAG